MADKLNGRLCEPASMNEVGAHQQKRKPFFFEGKDGASMPVETEEHAHGGD